MTDRRKWGVLGLITISAAGLLTLHAHQGPQPASPVSLSPSRALMGGFRSTALRDQVPQATRARLAKSYGKLPLSFIANRGQLDRRVAYYVPGRDKSLYFT